nr:error-prone DNA polymerase [Roseomonas haemaphysalidis]
MGAMSNFSFLEGASHPQELVLTARLLGHAAIGIADRNSMAGVVRALAASEHKDIRLRFVPGCRVMLEDGQEYLVWPSDRAAYGRLTRLLSDARMVAEKGQERISRDALLAAAEGQVMALLAPEAPDESFALRLRQDARALRRTALPLFCATHHRYGGDDRRRLRLLAGMAGTAGARLLAAGGVRFHVVERRRLADVLAAIRHGCTIDNLGLRAQQNAEAYLKPPAEMLRLFRGHEDAVAASLDVVRACGFSLRELRYEYPDEILEPGRSPQQTLEDRVARAAALQWPGGVPEKVARQLAHELALIGRLDYAPYFLTVHEIVRFAQAQGILCQGRGSAANSAVCYALGITAVPPDKHDLLFERFISEARDEPPDIDVDFEHERREEVIQHIYARYGRERAAICATLIRFRSRSAIREVGKAMGLSEDITARLARGTWHYGQDDWNDVAREQGLDPEADPRLAMTLDLAEELHGFPRHLATHVGGFVITRGRLTELAVVTKAAMADRHTLEWDKDDIEVLRMLKVDVLGLGMLSCLRRGLVLLEQHGGPALGLKQIPQDDAATYKMLSRGESLGVFQVESRAQMNMLPRMRPREFYDLVIEVAIVRPGPIQGDMVHPYLRRRNGEEKPTYPSPALEAVLKRTLGVPLFQEQAMQIAIVGAGFTPAQADELRRAMATFRHTGEVPLLREPFLNGMQRHGYPRDFAERCFKQIEGFGSYGFPESHASSFAQLVYSSAWLKRHHPAVFACALLNSQPMGFYSPAQIVREAGREGVAVRPVDVLASDWDCTLERQDDGRLALRLGLRLVDGLGEPAARSLVDARRGGDHGLEALVRRARLDRRAVEALAAADAFRGLGLARRRALWAAAGQERGAPAPLPLFAAAEAAPHLPEATAGEDTVLDYGATGLTLRHHPLALLRPRLAAMGLVDSRALDRGRQGSLVKLGGLVLVRQRPGSAKGVVFFTLEDEFGTVNLVLYPDITEANRAAVLAARLLLVEGRLERLDAPAAEVPVLHVIARRLRDRSDLLDGLHRMGGPGLQPPLARADEVSRGVSHTVRHTSRDWH